jgi:glycosyltransferase involved in cell wall biosynthesis
MKFAIYLRSLPDGGVEKMSLNLALALEDLGHDVIFIINSSNEDGKISKIIRQKFIVEDIGGSSNLKSTVGIIQLPLTWLKLTRIIRNRRTEVLVSSKEQCNLLSVLCKISKPNITTVIYRHVPILDKNTSDTSHLTKILYKYVLRYADLIIGVSNEICEEIRKTIGNRSNPTQICYVPNPVITDNFEKLASTEDSLWKGDDSHFKILGVGRLIHQKGFDILIKSIPYIEKEITDFRIYIIGDGESREDLVSLAKSLNCMDKIRFLGFVENPYPYMKNCDLFVLSSRYEGMPTVLIEALSLSNRVISSDCKTGPKEIVNLANTGRLFDVDDEISLAEAITKELKDNIRTDNKSLSEHFSSRNSASLLIKSLNTRGVKTSKLK